MLLVVGLTRSSRVVSELDRLVARRDELRPSVIAKPLSFDLSGNHSGFQPSEHTYAMVAFSAQKLIVRYQ